MKTNKISAMLLSAAIACTPVLTSAAQIVASAEETTTATTTAAAEAAVAVPVAVDPAAVVVAAEGEEGTTEAPATTAAPSTTAAPADTTTAPATTANRTGNASLETTPVDDKVAAANAMVKDMSTDLPVSLQGALIQGSTAFNNAIKANPNFNKFDTIYKFRMPDTSQGKMLYTPNPRWFINTPAPAVVGGSGESATITWDPVPMADGYRYTIRTYVIDASADSHDYSFEHTHRGTNNTNLVPNTVDINTPNTAAVNNGDKVLTGDLEGQLTASAQNKIENESFNVDRYPTKFRVKEDFTTNAKYQEQDATTGYTVKENWKEFTGTDQDVVVGYTYNLEKPSVSVSADVPVRIEIMIQAFRIDNATGELYNLSDVSDKRVVDLNWVAKESWEGMMGAPDQYEDEFFRAGYHKLDVPSAPKEFTVTWKSCRIPNTDKNADGYNEEYGYVLEAGNGIKDKNNDAVTLPTDQVQYVDYTNYQETFNLKDFDPSKKPTLLEITDTLKTADPARAALYTSINQAITDDFDRKVKAYNEWKRVYVDPIAKWNTDHADDISKAWRIAYKEAIKAYAASEYPNNKSLSMRYGLLDLDRNGVPELIVSFSSKADKNSYVVIDFQEDRAKLRTVHDKYGTEWYYEDVLGACARRGRCFKLDNLAPIDDWTAASDSVDPLATTTSGSGSSSASSSASSSSGSSSSSSSTDAGAPKTGDAGVAGLVAAAAAAVAGIFVSRRKKD